MRLFDWDGVHPAARAAFMALDSDLAHGFRLGIIPVHFRAFEGYRVPSAQAKHYREKRSKAQAWESAHQYGLAIDFVPYVNGRWTWDVESSAWDHLRRCAKARQLVNDLDWDRAHVEHGIFEAVRTALRL